MQGKMNQDIYWRVGIPEFFFTDHFACRSDCNRDTPSRIVPDCLLKSTYKFRHFDAAFAIYPFIGEIPTEQLLPAAAFENQRQNILHKCEFCGLKRLWRRSEFTKNLFNCLVRFFFNYLPFFFPKSCQTIETMRSVYNAAASCLV